METASIEIMSLIKLTIGGTGKRFGDQVVTHLLKILKLAGQVGNKKICVEF